MKIATRPELFPCSEVIGWILPREDVTTMILENVERKGYAAYSPGYVALAYHLPEAQVFLSDDWINNIRMDLVEALKKMLLQGKHYRYRPTGDYDTTSLRAPYRFIALMLNKIFGRAHGRFFKLEWIPIIFYVATQGTIFNWASIVSNSLSACLALALGGVHQKRSEFYMSSILVDCILCNQPFPGLRCIWDREIMPVYAAYKPLWAHKYHSHYREVCEHFIMPLYTLIFLKEYDCMSEEALQVMEEYADYYLTEDGLYFRMFGGSRAPSLLPKYATDYIIHKEAVRQVFLDGIGSFLFEHKKTAYPPLPFKPGIYRFARVKKADEFVEELERFNFGEMPYYRNDSRVKVA